MGDPQAPFETVLAVLERHGLLSSERRLRDDVQLVSMGDHFDWGTPQERTFATRDALRLLRWLTSHPADQVLLVAGNHDLARVSELFPFDAEHKFESAYLEAREAYRSGEVDQAAERAFIERFPHLPDAEAAARDFSCYSPEQSVVVAELLRSKRLRLAHAHRGLLLVHSGVTRDDFGMIGAAPGTADEAAEVLNGFLDAQLARWVEGPLDLRPLHVPGSRIGGVARGIAFHRPAFPVPGDPHFDGPPRRRYDPRLLPSEFPQAIGHIRDRKCRDLLGRWADQETPRDGLIRSMTITDDDVQYRWGTSREARMFFLDGGMNHIEPKHYQLFDLDLRAPLQPMPTLAISGT